MMVPSLAFMLLAPPVPAPPTARLVGASLFKNGFAVTQRLVDVPRPGTTTVVPIPQGAMGTLWFTPSEGLTLDSVVVENEAGAASTTPLGSLEAILLANVGRTATLTTIETTAATSTTKVTGRIVSAAGSIVVVDAGTGVRAIVKASVVGVEGKGLRSTGEGPAFSHRVMRLRTLGKPGRVSIVALERGLTWTPAYAVNLQPDGKTLVLVAKATVSNDLERLSGLDCRFVTGFPNLPFMDTLDPLVSYLMATPAGFPGGGFGGGGMGGGGFGGQQMAAARSVGYNEADRTLAANAQAPDGESLGELFFYHRPGVSVDVGGRAAYTLFRTTAPYDTVYTWDLVDPAPGGSSFQPRVLPPGAPSPEEVWQTLCFANTAKLPLTTGPATTFSEGQIIGQDTLRYASPGQTVELRVTRSLDLSPDFLEEETARERGFVKRPDNYPIYDRVTVRGTLTLVNRKAKAVKVRIRRPFTGEWLSGDGAPVVTTTAAGLRQPNPTGLAEWAKTVEPGATLKLTYSTRLLVNS